MTDKLYMATNTKNTWGGWASKLTPEERSKRMKALAIKKQSKLSKEQRIAHSKMMVKAKRKKSKSTT